MEICGDHRSPKRAMWRAVSKMIDRYISVRPAGNGSRD